MTPQQKQWVDESSFKELMTKWRQDWDEDDPLELDEEFLQYYAKQYLGDRWDQVSREEYRKISEEVEIEAGRKSSNDPFQGFY